MNLGKRIVQRLHWILYETEVFHNNKINWMIGVTHVIAIVHLLIANSCIYQLEKMLYDSNSVKAILANHILQLSKDTDAHTLQVFENGNSDTSTDAVYSNYI